MVDAAPADVVVVLTRAPSAGGKSRLFSSLQRAPDPALLTALLLDTLDNLASPSARRVVAVEPAAACAEIRALVPPGVDVMPQRPGTLGERMRDTMRDLFAAGAGRVVLVGSDLPAISSHAIADAFAILARDPDALVLGPAADGGYYLIAAARVPPVFDGIEWGSARVLEQTQRAATSAGLRVHLVAAGRDIDTVDDLRMLAAANGAGARRTIAWAAQHGLAGAKPR